MRLLKSRDRGRGNWKRKKREEGPFSLEGHQNRQPGLLMLSICPHQSVLLPLWQLQLLLHQLLESMFQGSAVRVQPQKLHIPSLLGRSDGAVRMIALPCLVIVGAGLMTVALMTAGPLLAVHRGSLPLLPGPVPDVADVICSWNGRMECCILEPRKLRDLVSGKTLDYRGFLCFPDKIICRKEVFSDIQAATISRT